MYCFVHTSARLLIILYIYRRHMVCIKAPRCKRLIPTIRWDVIVNFVSRMHIDCGGVTTLIGRVRTTHVKVQYERVHQCLHPWWLWFEKESWNANQQHYLSSDVHGHYDQNPNISTARVMTQCEKCIWCIWQKMHMCGFLKTVTIVE